MNHYPRYIGDYMRKTAGLSLMQDGAYTRAIDTYYANEGPLPPKPEVYLVLRCQSKAERDAVDYVLARYFTEVNVGFAHDRCDEEIEKFGDKSTKASKSAAARWMRTHSERIADAMPPQCDGSANQNQNQRKSKATSAQRTNIQGAPAVPDGVRPEVWDAWLRHRGKQTAETVLMQTRKLAIMQTEGQDPNAVVLQSIERNWSGLFEVKTQTGNGAHGTPKFDVHAKRAATAAAMFGNRQEQGNGQPTDITGIATRVEDE